MDELNIKELRKEQGMTQIELAVKVGVSLMTIQLWERGAMNPNAENYKKLCEALDILPFTEK
jgi:transcriptional regulator with XRE-family HTH domain